MDSAGEELSSSISEWRINLQKSWQNFMDNFITIRRRDDTAVPLLAPNQDIYLRENIRSRLLLPIPRLKTNNPEQLEKVLRQQIKNVGDRPLLWSTLGQSLMKHGEWQEASLAFRAALKQRPDAYDYAWLADALDRLHKPEEAAAMGESLYRSTMSAPSSPVMA